MVLQPLGDRAILATLPDEAAAFAFAQASRAANWPWMQDVVPAYATVGVFFDAERIRFREVWQALESLEPSSGVVSVLEGKLHRIPVCYERQLDLPRIAETTRLAPEEVIRWHTSAEFRIYAIGFVPGFPYMGYLPEALAGVPRLASPRTKVEPGSVGITGKQTGIYPLPRPGGWNILGQTPLTIVDLEDEYFPLRVGDRVRFERIDEAEFQRLLGDRL
jgi:inhibitor of KinA